MAVFVLVAVGMVVGYAVAVALLWANRDFAADGPLSFHRPRATVALDEGTSLATIERQCAQVGDFSVGAEYATKIVAARVDGTAYYACYQTNRTGAVWHATVVDDQGIRAPNRVIKDAGAWRWIGTVKTPTELVLGGCALAVMLTLYFIYYRRARPGPPVPAKWWQGTAGNAALGTVLVLPFTLPFRRGESRGRRLRLLFLYVFGLSATVVTALFITSLDDWLSALTTGWLLAGLVLGWVGGRALLRPPGFGAPDVLPRPQQWQAAPSWTPVPPSWTTAPSWTPAPTPVPPASSWTPAPAPPAPVPPAPAARVATASRAGSQAGVTRVRAPGGLPTFADVGGMEQLKAEVADTFGLLLAFAGEADAYRIAFNGVLLHGPPGVGKTFIARATAGEFGLNFLHVSTGDLVSKYVGESARNIRAVFEQAARHVPCLLFFDEFDSIAERRDDGINEESKRVVNQLLQSLEEWRPVRELVIMAATNHLDRLDPSVVRAGRFDRHIRVDLPDLTARRAILAAQLARRPVVAGLDLDDIARRTAGRTPATIARVVEAAALAAFRVATESGTPTPITDQHLRDALAGLGGTDRPTVEDWTWDRLVLDEDVKAELRQVQALVADPGLARAYGVDVPSGLLLAGPPGTGKTTIARVFAAQAGFSFYPQTAADLTSKWVGESEAGIVRLFARARDNAPSIIFIDEIDAVAGARSETGSSYLDRTLTQLLAEIDGMTEQRGVFVMAATNRPDLLDPALLRGGRLSRTITVPLPDLGARRRLLDLFCRTMPVHGVDLDRLAAQTDGYSGADLEALCQQAALRSMMSAQGSGTPGITPTAFAEALHDHPRTKDSPAAAEDPAQPGGYL
jgi:SpoVK/Ycf46/Vps4 family AAA+-type ATPase